MVASRDGLLAAAAQHGVQPGRRDRRGVQPPPSRPHGQRGAVPGRAHPRPLGDLRRRPVDQPRGRGRRSSARRSRLIATPGHTSEDITTLAAARRTACTPARTPGGRPTARPSTRSAATRRALAASRARILAVATVIIPGHGPAFVPGRQHARADPSPAGRPAAQAASPVIEKRRQASLVPDQPARRRSRSRPITIAVPSVRWACSAWLCAIALAIDSEYWPTDSRPHAGHQVGQQPLPDQQVEQADRDGPGGQHRQHARTARCRSPTRPRAPASRPMARLLPGPVGDGRGQVLGDRAERDRQRGRHQRTCSAPPGTGAPAWPAGARRCRRRSRRPSTLVPMISEVSGSTTVKPKSPRNSGCHDPLRGRRGQQRRDGDQQDGGQREQQRPPPAHGGAERQPDDDAVDKTGHDRPCARVQDATR